MSGNAADSVENVFKQCVFFKGIGAFTIVDGHTVTGEDVGNK